jgi:hypothetical protein
VSVMSHRGEIAFPFQCAAQSANLRLPAQLGEEPKALFDHSLFRRTRSSLQGRAHEPVIDNDIGSHVCMMRFTFTHCQAGVVFQMTPRSLFARSGRI